MPRGKHEVHLSDAVLEALVTLLDETETLPPAGSELARAREHAAGCPTCSHELGARRELRMRMRRHAQGTEVKCPSFLADQIMQAAHAQGHVAEFPAQRNRHLVTSVLAAACLVGAAAAGAALFLKPSVGPGVPGTVAQQALQTPQRAAQSSTPTPEKTIEISQPQGAGATETSLAEPTTRVYLGEAPDIPAEKHPEPAAVDPKTLFADWQPAAEQVGALPQANTFATECFAALGVKDHVATRLLKGTWAGTSVFAIISKQNSGDHTFVHIVNSDCSATKSHVFFSGNANLLGNA